MRGSYDSQTLVEFYIVFWFKIYSLIGAGYPPTLASCAPPCNNSYLDGAGSAVLESDPVKPLVEVDRVLAGDDLAHGGSSLFSPRRHCYCLKTVKDKFFGNGILTE